MSEGRQTVPPQAGGVLEELREVAREALRELVGWYRAELARLATDRAADKAPSVLAEREAGMAGILAHTERLVRLLRQGEAASPPAGGRLDVRALLAEAETHLCAARRVPLYGALAGDGGQGEPPGQSEDA
jgi:hypothetical protein